MANPWIEFVYVLSKSFFGIYLFLALEGVIYSVASQIRVPMIRSIFKWPMMYLNRFLYVDPMLSYSLILNVFTSNSIDMDDKHGIMTRMIFISSAAAAFSLVPWLFRFGWRKNREYSKTDQKGKWIWYHREPIIDQKIQQFSFANLSYRIYDRLLRLMNRGRPDPFRTKIVVVNILGNDRMYDPAWPRCSIGHSIAVINHCDFSGDISLHVLRTSFFRRQSRILWSYSLPKFTYESIDQLKVHAFENGGLILIFLKRGIEKYLWIIHLDTGKMISVNLGRLFPGRFFTILFAMRDDGSELGEDRNPSSIYVRLIYHDLNPGVSICYGQSLIEVPLIENGGSARIVLKNEFYWPAPFYFDTLRLFQTSCGQMGSKIRLRQSANGPRFDIGTLFWDPGNKKLVWGNFNDLVTEDRPLRLVIERYPDIEQLNWIVPDVLNNGEAMVVQKDWSVWRTSFHPPSLKSLCLEKVFGTYKKQLEKFNGEKFMKMTGVDASAYFQGKI